MVAGRTTQSFGLGYSCVEIMIFWGFIVGLIFSVLLAGVFGIVIYLAVCLSLYSWRRGAIRTKIRERLGIYGSAMDDWALHCCCSCCAVCQEAREAKHAGMPVLDYCSGEDIRATVDAHIAATSSDTAGSSSRAAEYISSSSSLHPEAETGSLWAHMKALSLTSVVIVWTWLGLMAALFLILAISRRGLHITVFLLTFLQPLLIEYFVYWRSRRQYAALDYVVKMFAVGFWFSTVQSICLEFLLQALLFAIFTPILGMHSGDTVADDDVTISENRHKLATHLGAVVVLLLLMAFVVAAGVEETMKHFAVRCCRFPAPLQNPHTVLVYLMSAALGFATAENLEYVFASSTGSGSGHMSVATAVTDELTVLLVRVLMPIHVICSVLQAAQLSKVC